MEVLAVAALLALLVVWRGWKKPLLTRGRWRIGAGLFSIGAIVGGAFMAIRGDWPIAAGLFGLGLALAFGARVERGPYRLRRPGSPPLADGEARALLGVSADADAEEIRSAYTRLMRVAHPDRGGSSGLAARLNAARDRLLKKGR